MGNIKRLGCFWGLGLTLLGSLGCDHIPSQEEKALVTNDKTITKDEKVSTDELIRHLKLQSHVEGGYYRRTFQADHRDPISTENGDRYTLTSIYYLLTEASPIGRWHLNQSDILHFFHLGDPITYYLIHPDGTLTTAVLGPDPSQGHRLQLAVPGGTWKASYLPQGEYGLISEAVAPGFDFADMSIGDRSVLIAQFPEHEALITQLTPTTHTNKTTKRKSH
ncbi:cupin domain-containing protein [Marinibactrum halimedae]|uniref:DUF985 domain-containing protein n=1 Tax=Marinibactrum halimedae TaxID=1444977 RepID=A0AA37T397_9GAMM|nr:cupin domain-containing protein [Marinibactrum halimedae]MCD9459677.1 cupin domain-containing protein [Marinibactrum halimedae]GLS25703.1 hypothetical protein GCM10007877_14170 [Marinibactrum halimedae]